MNVSWDYDPPPKRRGIYFGAGLRVLGAGRLQPPTRFSSLDNSLQVPNPAKILQQKSPISNS